jgi:hypothetical protein
MTKPLVSLVSSALNHTPIYQCVPLSSNLLLSFFFSVYTESDKEYLKKIGKEGRLSATMPLFPLLSHPSSMRSTNTPDLHQQPATWKLHQIPKLNGINNSSSGDDANSENFGTTPSNNDSTTPSNDDDSIRAELDAKTQLLLNQYMAKLNYLYASKIGHWSSRVRPLISKWLTW